MTTHRFELQVYYEDTDFSGVVYHANYLRFFERAREHVLGPAELVRLWQEDQIGFVVYKAQLTYREGAMFGDTIEVHSDAVLDSEYRTTFTQKALRKRDQKLLVEGQIEMVCVDKNRRLVPLPLPVRSRLTATH
ncbi:MAG: YbgC/FadM family acyl-CoA thioesterase [Myxococcota bacterium]